MDVPENYNFADSDILNLVDANHCPTEEVVRIGSPQGVAVSVNLVCSQDGQEWPCPIIVARRSWQAPA